MQKVRSNNIPRPPLEKVGLVDLLDPVVPGLCNGSCIELLYVVDG